MHRLSRRTIVLRRRDIYQHSTRARPREVYLLITHIAYSDILLKNVMGISRSVFLFFFLLKCRK